MLLSHCSLSFSFQPHFLFSMENKYMNLISFCFSNTICGLLIVYLLARRIIRTSGLRRRTLAWRRETKKRKRKNPDDENKMSLLDLPDLTLDCILEKLSPSELCAMSCVCSELRGKCVSDHLWEKHMEKKWGRLMGDAAVKEWKTHVATLMRCVGDSNRGSSTSNRQWRSRLAANLKPFQWLKRNHGCDERGSSSSIDSVMYWYSNLESGKLWFPAQVYNRENGHVGFMMSCYDAKVRYESKTDTFQAKYSAHGRRAAEENVTWQRVRPYLIDTESRGLHVSDCLQGLKPGDHFEIQWRRTKEFPYGWWFGIVGHLQNCGGEENCRCLSHENVVMEFRQFKPESPWKTTVLNRNKHRETGNEASGFYGGVKKLGSEEEISTWKRLWPSQVLD